MTPASRLLSLSIVGLAATVTVASCGELAPLTGEGPLSLPDGHGFVMAPATTPMYMTVTGCTEESVDLSIESVEALDPWDATEVTWAVAWPDEPPSVAGAEGPAPSPPFTALAEDEGGRTAPCGDADREGPVLAAQFPSADTTDIGFERIRVRYSAGGTTYTGESDISFGLCGRNVADPVDSCVAGADE